MLPLFLPHGLPLCDPYVILSLAVLFRFPPDCKLREIGTCFRLPHCASTRRLSRLTKIFIERVSLINSRGVQGARLKLVLHKQQIVEACLGI